MSKVGNPKSIKQHVKESQDKNPERHKVEPNPLNDRAVTK
jgi:hypothetical protein